MKITNQLMADVLEAAESSQAFGPSTKIMTADIVLNYMLQLEADVIRARNAPTTGRLPAVVSSGRITQQEFEEGNKNEEKQKAG